MKRIYFKLDGVTVSNIGPETVEDLPEGVEMVTDGTEVVEDDVEVAIGYTYDRDAETFTAPAPPAPHVPVEVAPLQMRRALRQLGLKHTVDAFLTTLDEETIEAWEYATTVRRDNQLITMAGHGLGMSEAQIDDLFRLAETLL
jgi:hypothetical protein